MTPLIYNRDGSLGAQGWIHIVPKGELPNVAAGKVQVLDDASLDSIMGNIEKDKVRLGNRWPGLYAGEEHFIYDETHSSEAFAWFKRFEKRGDGIWANEDGLTDLGRTAVNNQRFKFTSFVVDPADVQPLDGNRVRVMRIDSVGFTNLPNGKDMLVPITNRAAGPVNGIPASIQDRAAKRIGQLADQERHASGGSHASCYARVMNREKSLCELASGKPVAAGLQAGAREVVDDAASFAGRAVLRLAQSRKAPGLWANVSYIRNRFPRLARMENRQGGWDVLGELEPKARQAYMDAVQQPKSEAQPESRWNGFFGMLDSLKLEFPDLGYEGYWQKMKELYPATFLKFVLSFDDQEGFSDMLAPPPKTEQERYRDNRALIVQAATTEFQRYGRNGSGSGQLAQDTVSEALAAL